jgi:hypothetical protein
MGLSDHMNQQVKRGCRIITCDPANRIIEAQTQRGEVIQINAYSASPTFRWPKVGEKWIVREENGSWFLEGIWEEQTPFEPTPGAPIHVQPGDTVITASTGTIWKNVDGQLEPLLQTQLSVSGYVEDKAAKGKGLGTYEVKAQEKARFLLVIFNITEVEQFGAIEVEGDVIAITERSGSVGLNYKTTLTIVLPPGVPAIIKGSNAPDVSIVALWESV